MVPGGIIGAVCGCMAPLRCMLPVRSSAADGSCQASSLAKQDGGAPCVVGVGTCIVAPLGGRRAPGIGAAVGASDTGWPTTGGPVTARPGVGTACAAEG